MKMKKDKTIEQLKVIKEYLKHQLRDVNKLIKDLKKALK